MTAGRVGQDRDAQSAQQVGTPVPVSATRRIATVVSSVPLATVRALEDGEVRRTAGAHDEREPNSRRANPQRPQLGPDRPVQATLDRRDDLNGVVVAPGLSCPTARARQAVDGDGDPLSSDRCRRRVRRRWSRPTSRASPLTVRRSGLGGRHAVRLAAEKIEDPRRGDGASTIPLRPWPVATSVRSSTRSMTGRPSAEQGRTPAAARRSHRCAGRASLEGIGQQVGRPACLGRLDRDWMPVHTAWRRRRRRRHWGTR